MLFSIYLNANTVCNTENMVLVHSLSSILVVALELDLLAYQARRKADDMRASCQLPRSRLGWLKSHYQDTVKKRSNAIVQAIQNFNRERGVPVDTVLFKNANAYAHCLAPIDINDAGEVVYRGAQDSVWTGKKSGKSR